MSEELLNKYQEVIGMLSYKNPGCLFSGAFRHSDSGVAFQLFVSKYNESEYLAYDRIFKIMENKEKALKYFIKIAQNLVLKNMFNN